MSKHRSLAGRALRIVAVSGIALGAFAPTAAHASCYPGTCEDPPVGDPPQTTVLPNRVTRSSTLPFTGGDATGLAAIGVGAVAAGAVFVRQSKRRATA